MANLEACKTCENRILFIGGFECKPIRKIINSGSYGYEMCPSVEIKEKMFDQKGHNNLKDVK